MISSAALQLAINSTHRVEDDCGTEAARREAVWCELAQQHANRCLFSLPNVLHKVGWRLDEASLQVVQVPPHDGVVVRDDGAAQSCRKDLAVGAEQLAVWAHAITSEARLAASDRPLVSCLRRAHATPSP